MLAGERAAYALCRPPGHHATPAGFGGSCYLNNAAVAAEALRAGGHDRVAVIDIDAHQGNGTAAIFYDRADVLYGSVHVDPAAGWFPHIVGYADETGTGDGEGCTRNLPLPEGTADGAWLEAVGDLADWVVAEGCSALVVSLGVDAAADDPESPLLVTVDGYRSAGSILGATGLPAVVVQEGGYHLPTLGGLVAAYLDGHVSRGRRRLGRVRRGLDAAVLGGAHHQCSLDQQVQLLGRALGSGVAHRLELSHEKRAKVAPERRGLCMCRMGGIGEGEVGREVPAATEVCVRDELVQPIEEPEESVSGLGGAGQRLLVPREVLLGGAAEHRRDQAVLAAEVLVERPAGDIRLLQQRVDSDRSAV